MRARLHTVVSPTSHCYFDYPETRTSVERVYAFDPVPPGTPAAALPLIRGGEGCLWSERISPDTLFAKAFPRAAALATKLWHRPDHDPLAPFPRFHASLVEVHLKRRLMGHFGLRHLTDGFGNLIDPDVSPLEQA